MFDPKVYREACRELRAPEDKIEEVITMTENTNKKIRRPLRTALACAAAVAMMVVGVAAAALSGYLSIRLVRMVADKGKFGSFAYYCWIAGVVSLAASFLLPILAPAVP